MNTNPEMNLARAVNLLGRFCGRRDIPALNRDALQFVTGIHQADVYVLFGGSILAGGDVLAQAIQNKIAKTYLIVGGEGHTTQALREKMHDLLPDFRTEDLSEAELFAGYLERRHGCRVDYLECESTNCGNNITNLLALLRAKSIPCQSIILTQDATMQLRMAAVLKKYVPEDFSILNYAAYQAKALLQNGKLCYQNEILGMWEMERYISLLLGEIVRLRDDAQGYGPKGKNFIAHVDIPPEVEQAFALVSAEYGDAVRQADEKYAGKMKLE